MKTTNFFLGANSGNGFQSLFSQLTSHAELYDLMILKGGPGVGKSTFMKQIGSAMEAAGTSVEYVPCSGDPDSIDAVILPELHCEVVDGTAPHVVEPRYPGAVERYVDLGRFYDLTAAKEARPGIMEQTDACHAAYKRAFHSLKAARQVELETVASAQETMDWSRVDRRVTGIIMRELRRRGRETGWTSYRFLGGITCQGAIWRFDSIQTLCPKVYEFTDSYELAGPALKRLHAAAVQNGWDTMVCLAPEEPERMEHLLIPGLGLAFITSRPDMEYEQKPFRRIRLDAMVRPENRARLRFEMRMVHLLREDAALALREAKEAHDALENICNPYVDYGGVRTLAAVETGRLLSWM